MNVLGSAAIVPSTDRAGAVSRFTAIFGAPPLHEFQIDGRDLSVSVFPGVSVLAGPASALATLADLRATVFVGSLSGGGGRVAGRRLDDRGCARRWSEPAGRDPDGNLLEFVENSGAPG